MCVGVVLAPTVVLLVVWLPLGLTASAAVVRAAVGAVMPVPGVRCCAGLASCVVAHIVFVGLPILLGMLLCMLLPGMTSILLRTCP